MTISWDPLLSSKEAEEEIISATQKRQIRNILKSYVGMYDAFSELIQNALDAVDRRKMEVKENDYVPELWLTVDLQENSFTITDNGIGFNEKEFRSFLAPDISFKPSTQTRGNKGVGATYIAYGFDCLRFGTKGNGHEFLGVIKGGREWVDDDKGIVTRPVVSQEKMDEAVFESLERGSTFRIVFGGKNTRPRDLSWYSATTPAQWLYLLLIKTPLGTIDRIAAPETRINFSLTVRQKNGETSTVANQQAKYVFPHTKIKASTNLTQVLKAQEKLTSSGKDAASLPKKFSKSNGLFEQYAIDDVRKLRKWSNEELALIDTHKVEAYGYFAYSTSIWDQFNDKLAKLRKGYRVLRGGLHFANNRMIQGDPIAIPLTSNIGYQNQCHVIVHFQDADPDLGRKGFQPELKELGERIAVQIVTRIKKWKKLLKSDTGAKPDIEKEVSLHKWMKSQEEYEETHPLTLNNSNFFAPIHEVSITSEPQSEQDAIVLFNQLLAGGVIRGIKLLATSQVMQYDGVFRFVVKEPLDNHFFDKTKNPLGVDEHRFENEHTSPPKVLEYKFNMDALIHEFENDEKNEKDVHLVVAWDLGQEWRKKYEATSLLDLDNVHLRDFHGITHIFDSGTTQFYAIGLKELVTYLNDVEGVQEYQRTEYGEDLFE